MFRAAFGFVLAVHLVVAAPIRAQAATDQSGFTSTFEDGTLKGYVLPDGVTVRNWAPRGGNAAVENSGEQAHAGTRSLKTTGRRRPYQGPSINVLGKMTRGSRYRVTVWVRLAQDPAVPSAPVRVSLQRDLRGTTTYQNVVPDLPVTATSWTKLTNLFTLADDADGLSLYLETGEADPAPDPATGLYPPKVSFYVDDFTLAYAPILPIQQDLPSLKDVAAGDFRFGGAIAAPLVASAPHASLMTKHLGSLTASNAMKPGPIHPTLGEADSNYSFADADAVAGFARANGMTMRGHTLVWHDQNPAWLFKDASGVDLQPSAASRALVLQRLDSHIRKVVRRYRDVVSSWDVVNEVTDPSQPDGLRHSPWYTLAGPTEYIEKAFQVAAEEAPGARLCINEYITTDPVRRQNLVKVVQGLRSRGVPVSCVGHQMHVNVDAPSVADVAPTIQAFSGLGLDNQVTEMDVSVYGDSTSRYEEVPPQILAKQASRYEELFREYRRLKGQISSVTLWGIADDNTWLKTWPVNRLDLPLLFDENLQAKQSFWSTVNVFGTTSLLPLGGKVSVQVRWRNQYSGQSGTATAIQKADQYGFFYFSDPGNPEVFVKVLDFGAGQPYLLFWAGLTDFEYTLTFTNRSTGASVSFLKPAFSAAGGANTTSLPHTRGFLWDPESNRASELPQDRLIGDAVAVGVRNRRSTEEPVPAMRVERTSGRPGALAEGEILLAEGQVAVSVTWRSQYNGSTGSATPIAQQDGFCFFYFSDAGNPEVFAKVLDWGAPQPFKVFAAGLSDFEFTVTYRNVRTGATLVFRKLAGTFEGYAAEMAR